MATRTERGWAGHFCGAKYCGFRRNTLIEYYTGQRVIVSTVGNYRPPQMDRVDVMQPIGFNRYYETIAFDAKLEDGYWEIDVNSEISFQNPWCIVASTVDELPDHVDSVADKMHEAVVAELMKMIGSDTDHQSVCNQCGDTGRSYPTLENPEGIADAMASQLG